MDKLLRGWAQYFAFGVLFVSTILMVYVVYEISSAKAQFANQLINRSIVQTESELDSFFDKVTDLTLTVADQYKSGFWEGLPPDKTLLHGIALIQNYNPISSIGIGDRRGYERNIIPDTLAGRWLTREVFVDRWGYTARWSRWLMVDSLILEERWEAPLPIDTRERPWFLGALQAGGELFWTNPYEYTTGPEMGITASLLIQDQEADSLDKIIAFDLTLDDLNRFVRDLQLTTNQNLFLLNGANTRVLALHNYMPNLEISQLDSMLFVTPEELNSRPLLHVLEEEENSQAFSFVEEGETWWGIQRPYAITDSLSINIVSVLPERDFSMAINRTLWVVVGSFILILILSMIVVRNHNGFHRISSVLAEKNRLISDQKRVLFSEVHHRVKNNLALISAFMELDLPDEKNEQARNYLVRNQRRIKTIALVQEEGYRSQALGFLSANLLVTGILKHWRIQAPDIDFELMPNKEININVNQALTYGLLIDELLNSLTASDQLSKTDPISISLFIEDVRLFTRISIGPSTEWHHDLRHNDVVQAFLLQLNARLNISDEEKFMVEIDFELHEKKGMVSNKDYKV